MKNKLIVLALVAVLATGVLAPSFTGRTSAAVRPVPIAARVHRDPALFDKTRFLLHIGLAYFAVYHFVIGPYQRHAFAAGAPGRTVTFVKAGAAALFAYHEVSVAFKIANGSNSPTLKALAAPLNAFGTSLSAIGAKLHGNNGATGSEQDVSTLNSSLNSFDASLNSQGVSPNDLSTLGTFAG